MAILRIERVIAPGVRFIRLDGACGADHGIGAVLDGREAFRAAGCEDGATERGRVRYFGQLQRRADRVGMNVQREGDWVAPPATTMRLAWKAAPKFSTISFVPRQMPSRIAR